MRGLDGIGQHLVLRVAGKGATNQLLHLGAGALDDAVVQAEQRAALGDVADQLARRVAVAAAVPAVDVVDYEVERAEALRRQVRVVRADLDLVVGEDFAELLVHAGKAVPGMVRIVAHQKRSFHGL